jgi:uncharacterized alkaline shock family protein YloU
MNVFLRILLIIYAFCLMVLSAFIMVVSIRTEFLVTAYSYLFDSALSNRSTSAVVFSAALVFFILSLIFLLSGIRSGKDKKSVSKHTNIGEIKISLSTIENIALAASRKLNGVKETKASVFSKDDTVSITLNTVVLTDVNIPEISAGMQESVKKAVEQTSGVAVNDVKIIVENVHTVSQNNYCD